MTAFMYGSEKMAWKERFRIRAVQMDNHGDLISIRRMDSIPNIKIRDWCGVMKGLKVSSGSLAIWRELRMIGLLKGCM